LAIDYQSLFVLTDSPTDRLTDYVSTPRLLDASTLTPRADPGENRVVTVDVESTLLRGDVERHQGNRNVHVEEHPALQAVDVIVPFDTPVIPACLIRERQLLDQSVLREQVQRPVDRAVGDTRIAPSHALEDLTRRQMALGLANLIEHFRPLRCVSESLPGHYITKRDNESQ
jgi:hypothetical protein